MDCVIAFRDELQAVFGPLDWLPEADSGIHRFHVPGDKAGKLNGWYVLFADGIASGCFGSWKVYEKTHENSFQWENTSREVYMYQSHYERSQLIGSSSKKC